MLYLCINTQICFLEDMFCLCAGFSVVVVVVVVLSSMALQDIYPPPQEKQQKKQEIKLKEEKEIKTRQEKYIIHFAYNKYYCRHNSYHH